MYNTLYEDQAERNFSDNDFSKSGKLVHLGSNGLLSHQYVV